MPVSCILCYIILQKSSVIKFILGKPRAPVNQSECGMHVLLSYILTNGRSRSFSSQNRSQVRVIKGYFLLFL